VGDRGEKSVLDAAEQVGKTVGSNAAILARAGDPVVAEKKPESNMPLLLIGGVAVVAFLAFNAA
jgi:hypothetical protein